VLEQIKKDLESLLTPLNKEFRATTILALPGFAVANFLLVDLVWIVMKRSGGVMPSRPWILPWIAFSIGVALLQLHFCERKSWKKRLLVAYPIAAALFAAWMSMNATRPLEDYERDDSIASSSSSVSLISSARAN
jgi:hypothetical protein